MDQRIAIVLALVVSQTHGTLVEASFSVKAPREYMVCKPIRGVFSATKTDSDGSYPVLQGPEGKPGPIGKSGLQGPRGEPDYSNINKIVTDHVKSITSRIYALEKEIDNFPTAVGGGTAQAPTKSPEQITNEKDCNDRFSSPIAVGDMCYNIIGAEGLLRTHEKAQTDCEERGGNLADLDRKEIYNAIYNLADERYSTVAQAWTGMTYENDELRTRDGNTEITYAKWTSGYPRKSTSTYYASFTKVYIFIDTSSRVRRILNARPTDSKSYAVCSYSLKASNTTAPVNATTAAP